MTGTRSRRDPATEAGFDAALARLARARRAALARGLVAAVSLAALAALAAGLALERLAPGSRAAPFAVFLLFWGGVAVAIASALPRILPPPGPARLALSVGRLAGRGGFFAAAREFAHDPPPASSPFLVEETLRRGAAGLASLDARRLFADAGRPRLLAAALAAGLVCGLMTVAGGGARVARWIADPTLSFRGGTAVNLVVTRAPSRAIAGDDVTVEATSFGRTPRAVSLLSSPAPGVWRSDPLLPDTAGAAGAPLVVYRHTFEGLPGDVRYVFDADGARTAERAVRVARRPVVNGLAAVLEAPSYTGLPPDTVSPLVGRLEALAGTRVTIEGEASAPVASGTISFSSGKKEPVEPAGRLFRAAFTVEDDDTFRVRVVDSLGLDNERPVPRAVHAREDRAPGVEILAPADGDLLPRSFETAVVYRADDDYGLGPVRLHFMREGKDEGFQAVAIERPPAGTRSFEATHAWSLAGAGLFPGDRVLFFLEAVDRNAATGPGRARTETRRLLVPSLSQIYADVRREERAQQEQLEEIVDEGRRVRERIGELSEEMKAEGEMDWSRRREGRELLERQERIGEQLAEAAERLDRTLDRLAGDRMTSREIGEKMEEIGRLIDRIRDGQLRESIERFQRLLGEMSREEALAAMEEVELSTADLVRQLERTIDLLEQVLREERMEELLRRAGEMLDGQRALADSTEANAGDDAGIADRQEALADEMAALEEDAASFAEAQEDSALAAMLEDALARADSAAVEELMREAARRLREGQRGEASCAQQSAADGMLYLYSSLGQCRMAMSMTLDAALVAEIARAARRLVELSGEQEAAAFAIRGEEGEAAAASRQILLRDATDRIARGLYELAGKTMAIPDGAFLHLGLAMREMDVVLDGLGSRSYVEARRGSNRAFEEINLAVIELLRASASSGQGGGGARQRMRMMMQRQLAIREQLQRMLAAGGGLSAQEREGMRRLAGEQRRLEEMMRRAAEESRGAGELLGRLDDLADEMADAAGRIERGRLDEELLDRQERIVSRMLESQRSLERRDYTRERRSAPAGDLPAEAPPPVVPGDETAEALLEQIRSAMREKGPVGYEELLRLYFRALSRKVRER
ncbi:MAG: hypothetical protein JW876_08325 [Candidatus Krumholzibacteriota bacterium]|nr:hypothetical protein [Candidatus Krumholzibacteriota bacterium]